MTKQIRLLIVLFLFLGALPAQGQEHFSRNIEQTVFVPKGQWIVGLSANYGQSKFDNYQYLVIENIDGDNYSFKVSPTLCYMFQDDLGIGGRFVYNRTRTKMNSADFVLSSEDSFSVDNLYAITQSYHSTALLRQYMSLGKSKRFGILNEVTFRYGLSESKLASGSGVDFSGSFMRTHSFGVGVSPGLCVFLSNYSAVELNVGVIELGYSKMRQTSNQIQVANAKSKSANFKINLFSISLGVAFYL
ncbi:MAG: hypothetical protein ACI4AH_01000 [Muribaculaceae bacterium]